MSKYVIGDIHGEINALEQCLEKSSFNFENDQLICLGDVADRGANTYECFELLLTIKNLVYILGNHDKWFLEWLEEPELVNDNWLYQGGRETLKSYEDNLNKNIRLHHNLLKNANLYYMDDQNRLYVHGGFEIGTTLKDTENKNQMEFYWNRSLWKNAATKKTAIPFQLNKDSAVFKNDIFIGHTATCHTFPDLKPVRFQNVWNVDQGAAYGGKLTIMDVDTYDYWQSD